MKYSNFASYSNIDTHNNGRHRRSIAIIEGINLIIHQKLPLKMLEVNNLSCKRGHRILWQDISFHLQAGQCLRINGANGAGKSTLLRVIAGLTSAQSGEVRWQGQILSYDREAFHMQIRYLGHTVALKDDLNALENLLFLSQLVGQKVSQQDVLEALAYWNMEKLAYLPVGSMSQGQRQRVALSRLSIGQAAAMWILDEPWNSLDTVGVSQLNERLDQYILAGGIAIITSHQEVNLQGSSKFLQEITV